MTVCDWQKQQTKDLQPTASIDREKSAFGGALDHSLLLPGLLLYMDTSAFNPSSQVTTIGQDSTGQERQWSEMNS